MWLSGHGAGRSPATVCGRRDTGDAEHSLQKGWVLPSPKQQAPFQGAIRALGESCLGRVPASGARQDGAPSAIERSKEREDRTPTDRTPCVLPIASLLEVGTLVLSDLGVVGAAAGRMGRHGLGAGGVSWQGPVFPRHHPWPVLGSPHLSWSCRAPLASMRDKHGHTAGRTCLACPYENLDRVAIRFGSAGSDRGRSAGHRLIRTAAPTPLPGPPGSALPPASAAPRRP